MSVSAVVIVLGRRVGCGCCAWCMLLDVCVMNLPATTTAAAAIVTVYYYILQLLLLPPPTDFVSDAVFRFFAAVALTFAAANGGFVSYQQVKRPLSGGGSKGSQA